MLSCCVFPNTAEKTAWVNTVQAGMQDACIDKLEDDKADTKKKLEAVEVKADAADAKAETPPQQRTQQHAKAADATDIAKAALAEVSKLKEMFLSPNGHRGPQAMDDSTAIPVTPSVHDLQCN